MKLSYRSIEKEILKGSKNFSGLLLTGPRRAGKTTLLKKIFPHATYILLEDPDIIDRIKNDPRSFLDDLKTPVILDEIQNTPELFRYIRTRMDESPSKKGQWLLTGSQEAPLMKGVSESMAGRIAVFQLLPFSCEESQKVSTFNGGFPEILKYPSTREIYFRSYIQTYLERDIRNIIALRNLSTFRKFLVLLASRSGTILNKAELAAPLNVSIPTISEWIDVLEITSQILIVQPFYENFGKRLVKRPKVYFSDSGLLCYLLGILSDKDLRKSLFLGPIFETFVASEIAKKQINLGQRKEFYYFRDQQGLEVDFLIPKEGKSEILLLEAKATRTIHSKMGKNLDQLAKNITRFKVKKTIVHFPLKNSLPVTTLRPGTSAISSDKISTLF